MTVRLAAGLDGYKSRPKPCCDRRIAAGRELHFAISVADASDGSNNCSGAHAEGFGELAGGVCGKELVDRDLAFLQGNVHLVQERQNGIARDAGKNGSAERRCDGSAVQDYKNVGNAGLFDVAMIVTIEPEHVMKAFLLREARREKSSGVVSGGFHVTRAAGKSAHETFFGEQSNRLREVRADRGSQDDKAIAIRGTDEKRVVDAEINRSNVKGAAISIRNPVAIEPDKFAYAVKKK